MKLLRGARQDNLFNNTNSCFFSVSQRVNFVLHGIVQCLHQKINSHFRSYFNCKVNIYQRLDNLQTMQKHNLVVEMARATSSLVFGPSAKVLKQFANNFFNGNVIPGHCGMLANKAKFLFFAKFQNLTMKLFAAFLSLSPFCSYSVSLVSMQISEPF